MIDSLDRLIHTSLYGEMLLALAILCAFGGKVLDKQSERVAANVKRCTYLAFGSYFAVRVARNGITAPGSLITYAFRAFIAAGLTFAFCSCVFSLLGSVWSLIGVPIVSRYQSWELDREVAQGQRLHEEEEREREWRQEQARRDQEQAYAREEEIRRENEQAREKERKDCEQRIERLRFDLHLFYDSLPAEVRAEYALASLDQHLDRFAELALPPEEMTRRVAGLRNMLSDRANVQRGPFGSLEEVLQHFERLRDSVRGSNLPVDQADSLMTDLEMDQARAIRQLREQS